MSAAVGRRELAAGALAMAVVAGCVVRAASAQPPDDGYIVWRFVDNLVHGGGWAFTAGEPVSGSTSPLQVLLLALGCLVTRCEPPTANAALSFVALACAGVAFAAALRAQAVGRWLAWGTGLAVALLPLHRITFGLEGHLQVACIGGFWWAWQRERPLLAGCVAGLAVLARPDAALAVAALAAPRVLTALRRGGAPLPWRALLVGAGLVVGPWLLWSWWQFGELLPNTLAAKQAQGASGAWQAERFLRDLWHSLARCDANGWCGGRYQPFAVLAILGALGALGRGVGAPLFAAALAHALAYRALGVPFFHWYALPLHLAVALAPVTLATARWPRRARPIATLAAGALLAALLGDAMHLALPATTPSGYRQVGDWLAANTSPTARIGCYEIGELGWTVRPRPIVDCAGLVTPAAIPAIRRRDFAWLLADPPEFLVLHEPPWPLLETAIVADPRFAGFRRVGPHTKDGVVVFARP